MDKRTENLQQALETGTYYNVIRRTKNVSPLTDIIGQSFPEIRLPLGFAVGQHAFILPEGAFHVAAPQVKTKAFFIHT